MKKILTLAATALLAACSESELSQLEPQAQSEQSGAVKFDVYAQRGLTRGGGQLGDLTNKNIGANGFGVFGYLTDGDVYGPKASPNFMYNQQVVLADPTEEANLTTAEWIYEPMKFWPNEYGSAASSDGIDRLSFFAYAPWTDIEPTTGEVIVPDSIQSADSISVWQNKNIISVNKNSDLGDPIVKYRVDTDPATSVDLLWGVAAPAANDAYGAIDGPNGSSKQNAAVSIKVGEPFLNLVKPNNPTDDRLLFNLKHALAKVMITIDYIDDQGTPNGPALNMINAEESRIFVREFKISGWATEGALNLNNQGMDGEPYWMAFDGVSDLEFDDDQTFYDGRKQDYEGKRAGEARSEKPQGLNPNIVENYDPAETLNKFGEKKNPGVAAMTKGDDGKIVVKKKPELKNFKRYETNTEEQQAFVGTQLLFGGNPDKNGGFFYIIPRNSTNEGVNIEIAYDIETIDSMLAATISDGLNHGVSVPNVIRKNNIFGEGVDFKAGYQYVINLHLGMTSLKVDADVQPWIAVDDVDVYVPDNQNSSGDEDNLPPAGTTIALTTMTTPPYSVTFTTDGTFKGEYMAGTISGSAADLAAVGLSTTTTYYIPSTAKDGDICELLTFGAPSRRMTDEGENNDNQHFASTGIFVKIGAITPGQGGSGSGEGGGSGSGEGGSDTPGGVTQTTSAGMNDYEYHEYTEE